MTIDQGSRRVLKTREAGWAQALARAVAASGATPNAISVLSIVVATAGGASMIMAGRADAVGAALGWIGGAAGIQLRLLCNLIDGMVAIEGGKKSSVGALYNEVPDRIADSILLVAAGAGVGSAGVIFGVPLGWCAALIAAITAYIRVLGGTLTGTQSFTGPMAKQHRMFVLTLACLVSAIEPWLRPGPAGLAMQAALIVIVLGSAVTCWRRLTLIARQLQSG